MIIAFLKAIDSQITDIELTDVDEIRVINENLDLLFTLQLSPEMGEFISRYQSICFIDAHTGNQDEDINFHSLIPHFQQSPFTHHLTPASVLSIAKNIYNKQPVAHLLSIRGYEFGFSRDLSSQTQALVEDSIPLLVNWLLKS